MQLTATVTINADISRTFEAFTDLEHIKERVNGINVIEVLNPPAKMQVGTKWKETRTVFGKEATEVMWVTDLTVNQNYVVEAESHGTHYRTEYTFKQVDGGTEVVMTFEGKPLTMAAKFGSVLSFVFSGSLKKLMQQDMEDLKNFLEQA